MKSSDIYIRSISQKMPQQSIAKICLKITYLKFHSDFPGTNDLTHWGRVTHICVSNLTTIGSDNGLSPGRSQAIIRTNAGILLIEPLETNFNDILIEIHIFSFKKIHFKMSSGKWRPFCLGLNVLMASPKQPAMLSFGVFFAAPNMPNKLPDELRSHDSHVMSL